MNLEKLQVSLNKKILLYLLCIIPCIGFMIIGFYLLIELNIILWGVLFLILSGLSLIVPTVLLVIFSCKMKPLINHAVIEEVDTLLNSSNDVESFISENGDQVNFYDEYFIYNKEIIYYENSIFMAIANKKRKALVSNLIISVLIQFNDKKVILKLNKDLLNIIRNNKNIILSNREDLDYFLNNKEECIKNLWKLSNVSLDSYLILIYKKDIAGKIINFNKKAFLLLIVTLCLLFAGFILLLWSFNSKEGVKVTESNIGILIFRVIVSIIILSLSFIKASNIKWYVKLSFPIYLVLYWLGILFINNIFNYGLLMISTIYFIVLGTSQMNFKLINEQPFNRSLGFSMFLILILMREAFDFNMVDGDAVFIIPGIIGGIILLISIFILLFLYRKKKNEKGFSKANFWGGGISLCFLLPIFTIMILASDLILLNYCFDNSKPTYYEEEIIRLEDGDDYESDKAIILIENKEVELSISRSEYFEFKIGDVLIISKYSGAFNYGYYVIE